MKLTLLGTTTSPYARKIRILLGAIGEYDLLDTRSPEGAARLAEVAPLGKIPVLLVTPDDGDGRRVLPDSGLIASWLWATRAEALERAGFDLDPTDWADRELQVVVEGALDAAINRFYLLKDVPDAGYVTKQGARVGTALAWLDERVTFRRPLGSAALSLGCTLDWMAFRAVVDLSAYPRLAQFHADWRASGVGAGTEPG